MKTRSQTNSLPPTKERFNGKCYVKTLSDEEFADDNVHQTVEATDPCPETYTSDECASECASENEWVSGTESERDDDNDSDYVDPTEHQVEEITRYSPEGDGPYTKQEFIDYYGGTEEWDLMGKWEQEGDWGSEYASASDYKEEADEVTDDEEEESEFEVDSDGEEEGSDSDYTENDKHTENGVNGDSCDDSDAVSDGKSDVSDNSSLDSSVVFVEVEKKVKAIPALNVPLTVRGITEHMEQLLEEDTISVKSLQDDLRALETLLG